MDMTGGYRKLMKELFPQAKIIVDKYHYVRQITYAIERVRVEEQKRLSGTWRRYFKKRKYLLLKDTERLTTEDRIQLENLFRMNTHIPTDISKAATTGSRCSNVYHSECQDLQDSVDG